MTITEPKAGPRVTLRPARYFVVVDRGRFLVTIYKRPPLRSRYFVVRTMRCAVGSVGHETPHGLYEIAEKTLHPSWVKPHSAWVPKEEWGKRVPYGDPGNPLRGAFLALGDAAGVGLHGTADVDSLGKAESHGCIRLREKSALQLYGMLPTGTPVYVV